MCSSIAPGGEALLASEVTYLGMSDDESAAWVDYNRLHFAGHGIDQQWMSQAVAALRAPGPNRIGHRHR